MTATMINLSAAFTMLLVLLPAPVHSHSGGDHGLDCHSGLKVFDPVRHKKVYKIGVHAQEGEAEAWLKHNRTFQDYLTATAGQRFNPPIEFEMVTTATPITSWVDDKLHGLDFFYSDGGVFSCMGTEMGAQSIATTVAEFNVRGLDYELDMYAGVIFARRDRRDIATIQDLKDKVVAAQDIGDFAEAQVQFYQMVIEGLDYIMDPKQVIFGVSPVDIVRGVVRGDWDIGLVRTGMLEQATDDLGRYFDPNMFKVLNQQMYVMENGDVFPFQHSTPEFPEWPFYSSTETPEDVVEEVQHALQALGEHRNIAKKIRNCNPELCVGGNCSLEASNVCDTAPVDFFDPNARCDTTRELANLAWEAGTAGGHNGFRSPRSYFEIRNMQEEAGFLDRNGFGEWHCTRVFDIYEAVNCPTGFHRVSKQQFDETCEDQGVPCPEGLSCFCKPCTEAFKVSEYVEKKTGSVVSLEECSVMDVCVHAQQTEEIVFMAYDNMMRDDAEVRAIVDIDGDFQELQMKNPKKGVYQFTFSYHKVAIGSLSVYVNDLEIPGMPIQVEIVPRDCEAEYGNREPTEDGACVCGDKSFEIGETCMDSIPVAVTICAIVAFCTVIGASFYLRRKRMSSDQLWLINVEELHFNEPVEVIGQGAFGVVVLAQYRGTKVAIKRVIKPKGGVRRRGGSVASTGSIVSRESMEKVREKAGGTASNVSFDPNAEGDVEEARSLASGASGFSALSADSVDEEYERLGSKEGKGNRGSVAARGSVGSRASQKDSLDLDFLAKAHFGSGQQNFFQRMFPSLFKNQEVRSKVSVLDDSMHEGETRTQGLKAILCPWFDKAAQQKEDFMAEMRLLSKLRHPYITTVMGAVVSNFSDPMLVMEYMEYGSLYDLLRNETMYTGGDIILQIVRDVAQGLRFLHSSKPPIFHGDLKARNILIDSRFRAKVADFGLSTKKKNGLTGTPFFMAPEYLRGKSDYTAACDIYSLGVIFFEIYARDDPYKGESMKQVLMKVCNPSVNKRPQIPETMPAKFVEITKKCWSADPYYRPQAKDLDLLFMDMNQHDAEPLTREEQVHGRAGEKKNTVDMMYEVFPRHIADSLKAGKKVEPEDHDMVTIFFSDIVGFTTISKKLPPQKVCDMLDRLYESFDKLARAHQVFKVETIGDAYMGVTNLLGSQEDDHVKNIAEFAVEAIHAANKIYIDEEDEDLGTIKIRVGFHSGPVVSNVIGSLNPRYGLFGDTVNTASRMESTSVAGKIHCSEKSAKLLQKQAPDMRVRQRGKVAVKGKGDMVTYWVSPKKKKADDPIEKLVDDKSFDCIVVADFRGTIQRVNKTAVREFRYESAEEMIGLNVSDLVGGDIDAKTHDAYLANFHARDKSEKTSTTLGRQRLLFSKRKDGTQFQCIVGINAIEDENVEDDLLIGYIRCLEMSNDPGPGVAATGGCPVKKATPAGDSPSSKASVSGGCPVSRRNDGMADTTLMTECTGSKTEDESSSGFEHSHEDNKAEVEAFEDEPQQKVLAKTANASVTKLSLQNTVDSLGRALDMAEDFSGVDVGSVSDISGNNPANATAY